MTTSISTTRRTEKHRKGTRFTETVFDITQTEQADPEKVCASDELGNGEVIDVESEVD